MQFIDAYEYVDGKLVQSHLSPKFVEHEGPIFLQEAPDTTPHQLADQIGVLVFTCALKDHDVGYVIVFYRGEDADSHSTIQAKLGDMEQFINPVLDEYIQYSPRMDIWSWDRSSPAVPMKLGIVVLLDLLLTKSTFFSETKKRMVWVLKLPGFLEGSRFVCHQGLFMRHAKESVLDRFPAAEFDPSLRDPVTGRVIEYDVIVNDNE